MFGKVFTVICDWEHPYVTMACSYCGHTYVGRNGSHLHSLLIRHRETCVTYLEVGSIRPEVQPTIEKSTK